MRKYFFSLIFILSISFSFSQECRKSKLSIDLIEKRARDSIYKESIVRRVEYFSILNKDILPKYTNLKKQVLQVIDDIDLKEIFELKNYYNKNRLEYLTEMKETQTRIYKGVTAYSKIDAIILFETLDVFPDSYAILLNSTFANSRARKRDEILMNKIYEKYATRLSKYESCIQQLKSEMNDAKSKLDITDIFQNTGNKTEEETKKSDLIDLLIWAVK